MGKAMNDPWEYYRSPDEGVLPVGVGQLMATATGYRVAEDETQWARVGHGWRSCSWTADEIRKHCRRVDTEHEAIYGTPEALESIGVEHPKYPLEPTLDEIAREREITGREWFLSESLGVTMRAGATVVRWRYDLDSGAYEWITSYVGYNTGKPITEAAAIAWMQEHSIPWPKDMGPRCWLWRDGPGAISYIKDASNHRYVGVYADDAPVPYFAEEPPSEEYRLVSEALARVECGMAPDKLPCNQEPFHNKQER